MTQNGKNKVIRYLVWISVVIILTLASLLFKGEQISNIILILAAGFGSLPILLEAGRAVARRRAHFSLAIISILILLVFSKSWYVAVWLVIIGIGLLILSESLDYIFSRRVAFWLDDRLPLVRVVRLHREELMAFANVCVHDRVSVRPGERVPVDGFLLSAQAKVKNAFSGEVRKLAQGDPVTSGSIALTDASVEADYVGNDTTWVILGKIVRSFFDKESSKIQKTSGWLFIIQLIWVLFTLLWPLIGGDSSQAVWFGVAGFWWAGEWASRALSLNLITRSIKDGLIFKGWEALVDNVRAEVVVIDKTGTLTMEWLRMVDVMTSSEYHEEDIVRLAAALEKNIDHPIARTLTRKSQEVGLTVPETTNSRTLIGLGVQADLEGETFALGSSALVTSLKMEIPSNMQVAGQKQETEGATVIYLLNSKEVIGMFVLMDIVRPTAEPMIRQLRKIGIKETQIISGDVAPPVEHVATSLGIGKSGVWSNLSPERKVDHLKKLSDRTVVAVGDPTTDKEVIVAARFGIGFAGRGPTLDQAGARALLRVKDLTLVPQVLKAVKKMNLIWRISPLAAGLVSLVASAAVFGIV